MLASSSDEQTPDGVSPREPAVTGETSGIDESYGCCGRTGEFKRSPVGHMGGNVSVTSTESQQHGRGSRPGAEAVNQGTEIRQGLRCGGLAQAADVNKQVPDALGLYVASGVPARRLQRQLDSFTACDLFLGRFEMLGCHHRRQGGAARCGDLV